MVWGLAVEAHHNSGGGSWMWEERPKEQRRQTIQAGGMEAGNTEKAAWFLLFDVSLDIKGKIFSLRK
jgi:hypothetical protein